MNASQAWSKALAVHPVNADGIAYHGRHDDTQICFALFERGASGCWAGSAGRISMNWFWQVAKRYRVGLAR